MSRRRSKSLNDYYRLDTKDLSSRASFSRSLDIFPIPSSHRCLFALFECYQCVSGRSTAMAVRELICSIMLVLCSRESFPRIKPRRSGRFKAEACVSRRVSIRLNAFPRRMEKSDRSSETITMAFLVFLIIIARYRYKMRYARTRFESASGNFHKRLRAN